MNEKNARESLGRLAEHIRQTDYAPSQLQEYDVLQFAEDIHDVTEALNERDKYKEIIDIIAKALTSNSEYIYSRVFKDKAESGYITEEERDKVLETLKTWKCYKFRE